MIEKTQELASITINCADGKIHALIDAVVRDTDTGEEIARKHWRGPVDPGNTELATQLLGDYAEKAMALAGEPFGGWAELEKQRAARIAAEKAAAEAEAAAKAEAEAEPLVADATPPDVVLDPESV